MKTKSHHGSWYCPHLLLGHRATVRSCHIQMNGDKWILKGSLSFLEAPSGHFVSTQLHIRYIRVYVGRLLIWSESRLPDSIRHGFVISIVRAELPLIFTHPCLVGTMSCHGWPKIISSCMPRRACCIRSSAHQMHQRLWSRVSARVLNLI